MTRTIRGKPGTRIQDSRVSDTEIRQRDSRRWRGAWCCTVRLGIPVAICSSPERTRFGYECASSDGGRPPETHVVSRQGLCSAEKVNPHAHRNERVNFLCHGVRRVVCLLREERPSKPPEKTAPSFAKSRLATAFGRGLFTPVWTFYAPSVDWTLPTTRPRKRIPRNQTSQLCPSAGRDARHRATRPHFTPTHPAGRRYSEKPKARSAEKAYYPCLPRGYPHARVRRPDAPRLFCRAFTGLSPRRRSASVGRRAGGRRCRARCRRILG